MWSNRRHAAPWPTPHRRRLSSTKPAPLRPRWVRPPTPRLHCRRNLVQSHKATATGQSHCPATSRVCRRKAGKITPFASREQCIVMKRAGKASTRLVSCVTYTQLEILAVACKLARHVGGGGGNGRGGECSHANECRQGLALPSIPGLRLNTSVSFSSACGVLQCLRTVFSRTGWPLQAVLRPSSPLVRAPARARAARSPRNLSFLYHHFFRYLGCVHGVRKSALEGLLPLAKPVCWYFFPPCSPCYDTPNKRSA